MINDSDQYYMLRETFSNELINTLEERENTNPPRQDETQKNQNILFPKNLQYYSKDYQEQIERETQNIESTLKYSFQELDEIDRFIPKTGEDILHQDILHQDILHQDNRDEDLLHQAWYGEGSSTDELFGINEPNVFKNNQTYLDDVIKPHLQDYKSLYNKTLDWDEKQKGRECFEAEVVLFNDFRPIPQNIINNEKNILSIIEIDLYDIMMNEIQELTNNLNINQTDQGWISRNKFDSITHDLLLNHLDDFAKQKDIELCSVFKIRTDNIILLKKEQKLLKYRNISTFIKMYNENFMIHNKQTFFFTQKIFSDLYLPIEFKKNKLTKTLKGRKKGSKNKKKMLDVQLKKKIKK
jgi:hypothetical protein